jgi:hypothetical protein
VAGTYQQGALGERCRRHAPSSERGFGFFLVGFLFASFFGLGLFSCSIRFSSSSACSKCWSTGWGKELARVLRSRDWQVLGHAVSLDEKPRLPANYVEQVLDFVGLHKGGGGFLPIVIVHSAELFAPRTHHAPA